MGSACPGQKDQTAAHFPTEHYKELTKCSFQQLGAWAGSRTGPLTLQHSRPCFPSSPQGCQPPGARETPRSSPPKNPPAGASPLAGHPACAPERSPQAGARQPRAGLQAHRRCALASPFTPPQRPGHRQLKGAQENLPSSARKGPAATQPCHREPNPVHPQGPRFTREGPCSKAPYASKPSSLPAGSRDLPRQSHGATATSWKARQHRSRRGSGSQAAPTAAGIAQPHRLAATGSPEERDKLVKHT